MDIIGNPNVGAAVEELIEQAQKALFIATPYFRPSARVTRSLKTVAGAREADVLLLLRGGDKLTENTQRAQEFIAAGFKVAYLERLHAKIYISETEAILTSLNLDAASAQESLEVAVRFRKAVDGEAYQLLMRQFFDLVKRSLDDSKVAAQGRAVPPLASPVVPKPRPKATPGHCIRCNVALAFKPEKPLCPDCYKSWARFANVDFEESHCHRCGKATKTSAAKPLCRPCWSATA